MDEGAIHIHCRRDKRFTFRGGSSGWRGLLNRWYRRVIEDIPLFGIRTLVHIEYAQVFINKGKIEVEGLPFVESGSRVTNRFAFRSGSEENWRLNLSWLARFQTNGYLSKLKKAAGALSTPLF